MELAQIPHLVLNSLERWLYSFYHKLNFTKRMWQCLMSHPCKSFKMLTKVVEEKSWSYIIAASQKVIAGEANWTTSKWQQHTTGGGFNLGKFFHHSKSFDWMTLEAVWMKKMGFYLCLSRIRSILMPEKCLIWCGWFQMCCDSNVFPMPSWKSIVLSFTLGILVAEILGVKKVCFPSMINSGKINNHGNQLETWEWGLLVQLFWPGFFM